MNNPVNLSDPSGHFIQFLIPVAIIAVRVALAAIAIYDAYNSAKNIYNAYQEGGTSAVIKQTALEVITYPTKKLKLAVSMAKKSENLVKDITSIGFNGTKKTGPKPFGTGPHNKKISEVANLVTDGEIIAGGQSLREKLIPTPGGYKSSRRPDILVKKPDGTMYGINVGRTNKTGAPVKREVEAIYDLEDSGIPMYFVPYDIK